MSKLFIAMLQSKLFGEDKKNVDTKIIELDTEEEAVEFAKTMFTGFGYNLDDYELVVTETEHYYPQPNYYANYIAGDYTMIHDKRCHSMQHIHNKEGTLQEVEEWASTKGLPVRHCSICNPR